MRHSKKQMQGKAKIGLFFILSLSLFLGHELVGGKERERERVRLITLGGERAQASR